MTTLVDQRGLEYASLVLTTVVGLTLIVFANLAVRRYWALVTTYVLIAIVLSAYAMTLGIAPALVEVVRSGFLGRPDFAQLLAAALAALPLLPQVRQALARLLPIDPASPVHTLALVMTVLLFASQVLTQLTTDVVGREGTSGTPLSGIDLVVQELPFLLAAIAGVGLFIRRPPGAALARLGYALPTPWQVVLALVVAGAFFGLSAGVDSLSHTLTPEVAHKVDAASDRLLGPLQRTVVGVLVIAFAAGVCEEAIFRGALQPRLGIAFTSLLFAAVHTQYGLTLIALVPLLAGFGLGWVRRYANTTSSTITHVSYNSLVGFWALSSLNPFLIIPVEIVLLVLLAGLSWPALRRRARP